MTPHVVAIEGCVDDLAHLVARAENTDDIDLSSTSARESYTSRPNISSAKGLTGITS